MAGIKITLRDPDDKTKLIYAEFATARSFPVLKEILGDIARADTAETVNARRMEIAELKLLEATSEEELDQAEEAMTAAKDRLRASGMALFELARKFVFMGYRLAGASEELADKLADLTSIDKLEELKIACLFGAGAVDFTKAAGR